MKRVAVLLLAVVGPVLALPLAAQAVKPPASSELTISARPNPITFGAATTISGKLKGPAKTGVLVTLQDNPAPYTRGFRDLATTTTDKSGDYGFSGVRPTLNTRYRATTLVPPATSSELLVPVRIRVALRRSDSTPAAGQRVRVSGSAAPEHDGRRVRIQRQTTAGSWRTVARVRLLDAGTGRSRYSSRIRGRRDATYRARVYRDADHATGTSQAKSVDVH